MLDKLGPENMRLAHKFIERTAEESPNLVALLSTDGAELTYGSMNARANAVANFVSSVLACGNGGQPLIGVFIRKSHDLYISILSILKLGAAYVPLDPSLPIERLKAIVKDAEIRLVLATSDQKFPDDLDVEVLNIDAKKLEIDRQSQENPERSLVENDLAYVYFTSGSTGRPKGVMIEHRNLVNYSLWAKEYFDIGPGCRTLQFTTINFDLAVSDIFSTLMFGGTLVIPTDTEKFSYEKVADILDRFQVNIWMLAPAYLENMPIKDFPHLQILIVAGEVCSPRTADVWSKGRKLFNGYGPTECTVLSTIKQITSGSEVHNIGREIAGLRCYILNDKLEPVGDGQIGELYISGASVGRGYANKKELTDERFIADPFHPLSKMYKTGDMVRKSASQDIIFIGREDRQIKVHGHRIELGEIESALVSIGYSRAIVLAVDAGYGKRIIAHVTKTEGLNLSFARQKLKSYLPDYMHPAFIIEHDCFPLNAIGKVDLIQLSAINPEVSITGTEGRPVTDLEKDMAVIWADLLKLDVKDIRVDSNFFDLGGTSLKAIQLLSKMKQICRADLSYGEFCKSPCIVAMSQIVSSKVNHSVREL